MTKAEEFQRWMTGRYRNLAGLDGPRRSWGNFDPLGTRSKIAAPPGAVNIPYGKEPTGADIQKFIAQAGGNPYAGKGKKKAASGPGKAVYQPEPTWSEIMRDKLNPPSPQDALLKDLKRKAQMAFMGNEARNQEIRANMGGLRERVMGGLSGQGGAAEAQYREDSTADLERIRAYLAERGLAGSTILPAFMQQGSKELNLRLDANREKQAATMADADMQLTRDQNRFIEDQNDVGPDQSAYLDMLRQYEAGGQGQGYGGALTSAVQPQQRRGGQSAPGFMGGMSAGSAQRIAQQTQAQFNPVGMAQGMIAGMVGGGGGYGGGYAAPQQGPPTDVQGQSWEQVLNGMNGQQVAGPNGAMTPRQQQAAMAQRLNAEKHAQKVAAYEGKMADRAAAKELRYQDRRATYVPPRYRGLSEKAALAARQGQIARTQRYGNQQQLDELDELNANFFNRRPINGQGFF